MTNFRYKQLGDSHRYSVIGKTDGREYAIFSLLYAPFTSPPSCRHLALDILQSTADEILTGDIKLLREICHFVFRSVLRITHEEKGVEMCKIYSSNDKVHMLYKKLAEELDGEYNVSFHRRWIEIVRISLR